MTNPGSDGSLPGNREALVRVGIGTDVEELRVELGQRVVELQYARWRSIDRGAAIFPGSSVLLAQLNRLLRVRIFREGRENDLGRGGGGGRGGNRGGVRARVVGGVSVATGQGAAAAITTTQGLETHLH